MRRTGDPRKRIACRAKIPEGGRFAAAVGMPFREYQNWIKQRRVYEVLYSRRSLTQVAMAAGFADSPQFARMFRRWYGQSPSYSRDPKRVRIVIHPNWRLARP